MKITRIFLFVLIMAFPRLALTEEAQATGEVKLPLQKYSELVEKARTKPKPPVEPPAGYALGKASVSVTVNEIESRSFADVKVDLNLRVLKNEWVTVPILPSGTPVSSVVVGGKNVELVSTKKGLGWSTKNSGNYNLTLNYTVDALRSKSGFSLPLPVPAAAAISLKATLPGTGLDVAVIPSAGVRTSNQGSTTVLTATVPSTTGIQLSWRTPADLDYSISRARYHGRLENEAVVINGAYDLELFNDETLKLKLLPQSVTLSDVTVDGKESPILIEDFHFAALVKGRGKHTITTEFHVPVVRQGGPPRINLEIPRVPVSRIELSLPGKKEIKVQPTSNIRYDTHEGETIAVINVPLTGQVAISWNEAVPEDIQAELRANAAIFHIVHAEEGVLYVRALASYKVTRGETNVIEFEVPKDVQINTVTSNKGGIADWRVSRGAEQNADILSVYLDQKLKDEILLDIKYDQSLVGDNARKEILTPLLKGVALHRQRGMAVLLSSKELTLKTLQEERITRVGENQLPSFVRNQFSMKVVNTYKYVERDPVLTVQLSKVEKRQGKFDAIVNTLMSLSDVTMKGSASVEINVKSGTISELSLVLPKDVNFLSISAPSLRNHKLRNEQDKQWIDVQFTQEMEGQFRIELAYELITADKEAKTRVPTVAVSGAEVEQGQIAVEALSAVEVEAASIKQLSSLDASELPRQLILKTTNPILLAYKYVHVDPPYELVLKVTRHKEMDVESATIDKATYNTLYTKDGLAVTTANFIVRNSRKQFLKVKLPEASKVWSVSVNGKAEKPAYPEASKENEDPRREVLIKIINSVQGFPVQLIYQTEVSKIGVMGTVAGELPRPDMVVTQSTWNVYLPHDVSYGEADANMDIVKEGVSIPRAEIRRMQMEGGQNLQVQDQLLIKVPAFGILYTFEKLYANKAEIDAHFTIPYISGSGATLSSVLVILGTLAIWAGIIILIKKPYKTTMQQGGLCILIGLILLLICVGHFGVPYQPAVVLSVIIVLAIAGYLIRNRWTSRKAGGAS
jgi:hypothetical protein